MHSIDVGAYNKQHIASFSSGVYSILYTVYCIQDEYIYSLSIWDNGHCNGFQIQLFSYTLFSCNLQYPIDAIKCKSLKFMLTRDDIVTMINIK